MKTEIYHGYEIAGNQFLAIAININDPKDVHTFDIDPDVNNDAFVRAMGWAYEPPENRVWPSLGDDDVEQG